MYLKVYEGDDGDDPPWGKGNGIKFQFWPESMTDSRAVEWNPRNIPGGSHPIYQWTSSGERKLAFTAVFARDTEQVVDPVSAAKTRTGILGEIPIVGALDSLLSKVGLGPPAGDPFRDPPLDAVVNWLRWFTYPRYSKDDLRAIAPAKCFLATEGHFIGHDGSSHIICLMTGCEVTYEAWFPNGSLRIIEVALEFAETVQTANGVKFHSRDDMNLSVALRESDLFAKDQGGGGLLNDIAGFIPGKIGL